MLRFFMKAKGSITIFLALILLPTMTGAGVIVDAARVSAAKTSLSGAGDLAMNAALSEYDKMLYEVYGIFAISENMEELQKNVNIYFQNTINNSGIMTDSDSYSREFLNSIFTAFSSEDMEFSNIVDIQVDGDIKLSGVESAVVANSNVFERQIVEYMKYRGPINISKGLLTKLGCIGETAKQTKAVEAKVSYERNLGTVQSACDSLYNDINTYNDNSKNSLFKDTDAGYLAEIDTDVDKARERMETLTLYAVALKDEGLTSEPLYKLPKNYGDVVKFYSTKGLDLYKYNKELWSEIKSYHDNSTDEVPAANTLDYIANKLENYFTLNSNYKDPMPPELGKDNTFYYSVMNYVGKFNAVANKTTDREILAVEIDAINAFNEIPRETAVDVMTYLLAYDEYVEKLESEVNAANERRKSEAEEEAEEAGEGDDEAVSEEPSVEYEELTVPEEYKHRREGGGYGTMFGILIEGSNMGEIYREDWKESLNKNGREAAELLYKWQRDADNISEQLRKAVEDCDALLKLLETLEKSRENWGNAVNDLQDSDVKSSMKGEYQNSAKDLNAETINALKSILSTSKQHFDAISEALQGVTLLGEKVSRSDYETADFFSVYSSKVGAASAGTYEAINQKAAEHMGSFVTKTFNGNIEPAKYRLVDEKDNDAQFYTYLKRICTSAAASTDEGTINNANNLKTQLTNEANKEISETTGSASLGSDVPETVSGAISDVLKDMNELSLKEAESKREFKKSDISGSDDDSAKAQQANLTGTYDLLEALSNINSLLEGMRDGVYIEEYMTEMFSCYTDTVPDEDGKVKALAMNGQDMTSNVFFGAEQEYILWGKDNAVDNINNTKALIFAIRFALNTIFAMTNSTTRTPALAAATAIAGWTGFGVPIVQTVILLAWALAESFVDLEFLCEGRPVALYKNNNTWFTGVGGAKQLLIEEAKKYADKLIDDVFDEIDNMAVDTTGKITGDVKDCTGKYIAQAKDGIYNSVKSALSVPVEQLAMRIAGTAEALDESGIREMFEQTLNSIKGSASGLTGECINMAIDGIIGKATENKIVSQLVEVYNGAVSGSTVDQINTYLYGADGNSGIIGNLFSSVEESIRSKVDAYIDDFESDVDDVIHDTTGKAKEALKDRISEFTEGISGSSSGGEAGAGGVTAAAGFTMNYQEYVKVFFLIELIAKNAPNMEVRAAKLIQANIAKQGNDGFNIAKAYTMIKCSGSVQVRTTFLDMLKTATGPNGEEVVSMDTGAIGSNWHQLTYISVLGY